MRLGSEPNMQRALCALFVFAMLTWGAEPSTVPNLSGTWKMDPARSESAHQDVAIGPITMVIRQTPEQITIETIRSENGKPDAFRETLALKLDGTETTSTGDAGAVVTAKAHWDGQKLITETARNLQDSTVTTLYAHSLAANGRELTVEKSLTVQHGYQFRGAATTGRGKDIFVKSAE